MGFPTTATFDSLIDEVIHNLSGFTQQIDAQATVTAPVGADDLSISVDDASSFSRGIAEIDDELIFIRAVDTSGSMLHIAKWGRGYRGTTKAGHDVDSAITMAPVWPRATVAREINNTIRALYPYLFGVKSSSFTYDANQYAYELPAEAVRVLEVQHRLQGTIKEWVRVRHWDTDHKADTTDFPSGKAVYVYSGWPGATIRVLYAVRPAPLANGSDVYATVTGLPESTKDLVVLGASYRLAPYMDVSRLGVQSVEADELDQPRQVGTAAQIARQFKQEYMQRLLEEKQALDALYPARFRRTR